MKKFNSSGERLYTDGTGAKCNLRGMLKREPEWVIFRFMKMENDIEDLNTIIKEIKDILNITPELNMSDYKHTEVHSLNNSITAIKFIIDDIKGCGND